MSKNPVSIVYNDSFDEEHYPLRPEHVDIVQSINDVFYGNYKCDINWFYHATIHGKVFTAKGLKNPCARIHKHELEFLLTIPDFRAVTVDSDNFLQFHVEH